MRYGFCWSDHLMIFFIPDRLMIPFDYIDEYAPCNILHMLYCIITIIKRWSSIISHRVLPLVHKFPLGHLDSLWHVCTSNCFFSLLKPPAQPPYPGCFTKSPLHIYRWCSLFLYWNHAFWWQESWGTKCKYIFLSGVKIKSLSM